MNITLAHSWNSELVFDPEYYSMLYDIFFKNCLNFFFQKVIPKKFFFQKLKLVSKKIFFSKIKISFKKKVFQKK